MHAEVLDFCDDLEPGTAMPMDGPSGREYRRTALRPGPRLQLVALSPGDGHRSDSLTVADSSRRKAYLRTRPRSQLVETARGPARVQATTPRVTRASVFLPLDVEELASAWTVLRLLCCGMIACRTPEKPGRRGRR